MPEHLQELVRRAAAGDNEAFGDLYRAYFDQIYDFLCRLTRNADDAADLAQETFLRAMDGLPALREAGSFKTWLFSIAHHAALGRMAAARRTTPLDSGTGDDTSRFQVIDHDRLSDPEAVAIAEEVRALVWEAAEGLEPRQRSVLALHVREGMDVPELAESLGMTRNNAAVLLHRTRKAMEEAVGAAIVVRAGRGRCPELAAIVASAEVPSLTQALRNRVDEHIESCGICRTTRRRMTPLAVFGAFAPVAATAGLKEAILERLAPHEVADDDFGRADGEGQAPDAATKHGSKWRASVRGWPGRAAAVAALIAALAVIGATLVLDSEPAPASGTSDGAAVALDRDATRTPTPRSAIAVTETAVVSPDGGSATAEPSQSAPSTPTPTSPATPTPDPAPIAPGSPELPIAPPPAGETSPSPVPGEQITPTVDTTDEGEEDRRTCAPSVAVAPGRITLTDSDPSARIRVSASGDCESSVRVSISGAPGWLDVSATRADVSPGEPVNVIVSLRRGDFPAGRCRCDAATDVGGR